MPIVYENDGHRRRMMRMYEHFAWKMIEWRKDNKCRNAECGKKMHIHARTEPKAWRNQATIDHIIARSLGGSDTPDNWQLICGACNNKKSKLENIYLNVVKGICND